MADGRFFQKPLNRHISAILRPILTKFGVVVPYSEQMAEISNFLKIPEGSAAILKSIKSRYISNGLADSYDISHADANYLYTFNSKHG